MTKSLLDGINRTHQLARIRPAYLGNHPSVDRGRWYQVIDPEALGFYIDVGGALRFVPWSHFEVTPLEARAG